MTESDAGTPADATSPFAAAVQAARARAGGGSGPERADAASDRPYAYVYTAPTAAPGTAPKGHPGVGAPDAPRHRSKVPGVALAISIVGTLLAMIGWSLLATVVLFVGFVMGAVSLLTRATGSRWAAAAAVVIPLIALTIGIISLTSGSSRSDPLIPASEPRTPRTEPQVPGADPQVDRLAAAGTEGWRGDAPAGAAAPLPIETAEVAFGPRGYDDKYWFVVVLHNPNADAVFHDIYVEIEARDSDGALIDDTPYYVTLLPGRTALRGSFGVEPGAEVATLTAGFPDGDVAGHYPAHLLGSFTAVIDDVTDFGEVTGVVRSDFAHDIEWVEVIVVTRDASGAIVDAATDFLEVVPAGDETPFSAYLVERLSEHDTVEVFVTFY